MARARTQARGFFGSKRRAFPVRRLRALPGRRLVPGWFIEAQRKTITRAHRAVRKAAKPVSNKITPEQRLVQRTTAGLTLVEMAEVSELGYKKFLSRQLSPETLDDGGFEDALNEALPTLAMTPYELNRTGDQFQGFVELVVARLLRSAFSPRQLFERMVEFWTDHFSIDALANHGYLLKPTDERDVIRPHALGRFDELLSASAHSPAMLEYLTNDSNVRGHPNENYARELMELHTMGVDNGYTQEDVREVARCFTGWRFHGVYNELPTMGTFKFEKSFHDQRSKRVLGRRIKSGRGEEDGLDVIAMLAERSETADFIAYKMLRFFQGYEPDRRAIKRVAGKFKKTGGNLRSTMKTVLSKANMKKATPKLKRPQHLVASAIRATSADPNRLDFLIETLEASGHLPYAWSSPDGYPDNAIYWSGYVLPRWNFAADMPDSGESGISVAPAFLDDSLSPSRFVRRLDQRMFNGTMTDPTRIALEEFLNAGKINTKRLREAVGIALAAPEFQTY